jgi:hypothetical protein
MDDDRRRPAATISRVRQHLSTVGRDSSVELSPALEDYVAARKSYYDDERGSRSEFSTWTVPQTGPAGDAPGSQYRWIDHATSDAEANPQSPVREAPGWRCHHVPRACRAQAVLSLSPVTRAACTGDSAVDQRQQMHTAARNESTVTTQARLGTLFEWHIIAWRDHRRPHQGDEDPLDAKKCCTTG